MIVDMFMTIPPWSGVRFPPHYRDRKKTEKILDHLAFSSNDRENCANSVSRRKRTGEKRNVNKPRFRFYLRSREITKLSFPFVHDTDEERKEEKEGGGEEESRS